MEVSFSVPSKSFLSFLVLGLFVPGMYISWWNFQADLIFLVFLLKVQMEAGRALSFEFLGVFGH